jgi:hypothetical protein
MATKRPMPKAMVKAAKLAKQARPGEAMAAIAKTRAKLKAGPAKPKARPRALP